MNNRIFFKVYSYSKIRPKLLGVYSTLPYDLYRANATEKLILRHHDTQMRNNRGAYDFFRVPMVFALFQNDSFKRKWYIHLLHQ